MNRVYFGAGAYGIEAAAQRYFNTSAKELTLGQAALLAGAIRGPSRYSPLANQQRSAQRADIVLSTMVQTGKITEAERQAAIRTPVRVSRTLANQNAQYFVDWVDGQVRGLVGEPTEDLVVQTTLDLPIQMAAERAAQQIVERDRKRGVEQAALVALDGEGRVRAYVGGQNYLESQFDRASNAKRQAGSAFKPFVYLTAMEQGRTPYETVVDEPVTIGNWSPRNYDGTFSGPMMMQTALAKSINTVAARLASEVGTGNVASSARRLGITGRIQTDPSMALGAVEVTPVEMAQAFAPFANGGYTAPAYGIEKIATARGQVLYDAALQPRGRRQVIGYPALQYMNQMMRLVPTSGTGTRSRVPGYDLAGKTGTTSDYKDAWYVGYTGGFVAAVWVGRDNNRPMQQISGGSSPAEIWRLFMAQALPRLAVQEIPGGPAPPPQAPASDPLDALMPGDGTMEPIPNPEPGLPVQPPPSMAPKGPPSPGGNAGLY
jgi:penicillin-binding protein 1A